jgi:hypothetical protein
MLSLLLLLLLVHLTAAVVAQAASRTCPKDDHVPVLQVPDGAAPDVGLSHLAHLDGRLHPGRKPQVLNSSLHTRQHTAAHAKTGKSSCVWAVRAKDLNEAIRGRLQQGGMPGFDTHLQAQGVHDCRQHAHIVCCRALQA